jgi:hypothetical protein
MSRSRNGGKNSASSSWEAHLQKCDTDANRDEKASTPVLSLDALKVVGRLVRAFKARVESESRIVK